MRSIDTLGVSDVRLSRAAGIMHLYSARSVVALETRHHQEWQSWH
jgi:hypothetical protein